MYRVQKGLEHAFVACGLTCIYVVAYACTPTVAGERAQMWWAGGLTCGGICVHGGQVGSRAVAHACMAVRWAHAWPWVAHAVAYA